jgi:hypothetical protein
MPVTTTTTIKTNPLPNGVYWLDVFSPTASAPQTRDGLPHWRKWASENIGRVITINTEDHDEPLTGGPKRVFVVFRVTAPPTPFPFAALGFPAVAERPDITSQHTTTNTPEPSFDWRGLFAGATPALLFLAIAYALTRGKD